MSRNHGRKIIVVNEQKFAMMTAHMSTLSTEHSGILISYDERDNKWKFTLRERDRSTESLKEARDSIDKPVAQKAKPFEKIKAWEIQYGEKPTAVEITGIGPNDWSNKPTVWIKDSEGMRRKEAVSYRIYPQNLVNDTIVRALVEKKQQISKLESECSDLRGKLEPLNLEIPE